MSRTAPDFPLKSRQEQLVEHRHGATVEALLRRLYVDDGLTQEQVAAHLGVSRDTVYAWMVKHEIPTRDRRAVKAMA
jgi:excisionase family DNA binding protein